MLFLHDDNRTNSRIRDSADYADLNTATPHLTSPNAPTSA
jgi:hypothetical protein